MKKQETDNFNSDETKQPPAADPTQSGRKEAAKAAKILAKHTPAGAFVLRM